MSRPITTQRNVLAILVAAGGRPVTIDDLARAVYGSAGPDERAAVCQTVRRLRQRSGVVVVTHGGNRRKLGSYSIVAPRRGEPMTEIASSAYQEALPFEAASDTSREAAESMLGPAGNLRARVLRFIAGTRARGATDEEIQRRMPLEPNTERPRRRELELAGYVERTETKRLTRSGRRAHVYTATEKGRVWVAENTEGEALAS